MTQIEPSASLTLHATHAVSRFRSIARPGRASGPDGTRGSGSDLDRRAVRAAPRARRAVAGLLAGALSVACVAAAAPPAAGDAASSVPAPGTAAAVITPATCALQTLAAMSESQRIGQLFMVGLVGNRLTPALASAISSWHLGSVWFPARTTGGVAAIRSVADAVQARATPAATDGVRFFVAANQEGGLVQALAGPGFSTIPSALDQGALPLATLEGRARAWGLELRAAGVNLDFAPVADVVPPGGDATNAPIGQLRREYGHDPATVQAHVRVFIHGMAGAGIATTAKHFPGLGRVRGNTDFVSAVRDTVTREHDPYLVPFAAAVSAGVPFVMVSLATYSRIDASHLAAFSRTVIGTVLRRDLHFGGVVMSDSLTAAAVASVPAGARAVDFVAAGGDMIVVGSADVAVTMARGLAAQAARDPWFRSLVDAAALRVLVAKGAYGLLSC